MAEPQPDKKNTTPSLSRSLRVKIRLSGFGLTLERIWQAFWPAMTTIVLLISLILWDAHLYMDHPIGLIIYSALACLSLTLIGTGFRNFQRSTMDDAVARLDANVAGKPVTALMDRPLIGSQDAEAQELWALHQQRMEAKAAAVDVPVPNARLARKDPWGLRLIALVFLGSALLFARMNSDESLLDTLQDLASGTTETSVSYEAWAEPPAYTGFPSIYLNDLEKGAALELPEGTQFILRSYGTSALNIESEVADMAEGQEVLEGEASFSLQRSGELRLKKGFRTVGIWDVTMIPDLAPTVSLTEDITRTVQGSLQMAYAAGDDYGITGGHVTIALELDKVDRRHGLILSPEITDPVILEVPLPFNADVKDFEETLIEDLAEHPWAGLPVTITLTVVDAAGNSASIKPVSVPMPGKRFFDTLAAALAEQRRDILWNRDNVERADLILKSLTHLPERGFQNVRAYLMVRSVIRRLGYDMNRPIDDVLQGDIAKTIWRAALLIEDGDLSNAAERLKRAQERLSEAMKNGATDEEIAELMDELREATDEYIRELAENAQNQDRQQAQNENAREVSPDMLQEMMDRIQELMEQGRMDEAQALLQQLQQMMENMQVTQGDPQGGGERQDGNEGLQDTLREQQELADENFQQMQDDFNRNQRGQKPNGQQNDQQGSQQGQGGQDPTQQKRGENSNDGEAGGLSERQEALRELMQQQLDQLGEDGSEAGQAAREALEEAERKMGEARDNLEEGNGAEALNNQADAVEALRQGMRQLGEAENQQAREGQARDGQQGGESKGPEGEDPLGRSSADGGTAGNNDRLLKDGSDFLKSKELLDEIRRRSGERTRPQLELDYLDRLLDRF
ncbi:TIGR02302 family protein [Amylibacter sp. SFDW26]|uniref:TIGR02302 family protein n=1 Tax=Amylibacter sp. SFDW26 TaxID=2652722 RepID=UPI0012615E00|nr:TIGR02302 family protein [Amylibacter sp. SFDW26]KAB7614783.1 TIGR02302 family protein [Amylibacter sp. SFDW26]